MAYRYPVDFTEPDHTNPVYHSGNMGVKNDGMSELRTLLLKCNGVWRQFFRTGTNDILLFQEMRG
ncbi:TPA: hypothetical protein HMJ82_01715 [Escherichia coli]|nr:hypothetical protein CIJ97_22765 [Escherichia coli]OZX92924.1 hypothetical protein CIJ92_23680 [Escherichia coli]HAJ1748373.1 hypothetical protein [Escherichia coli]